MLCKCDGGRGRDSDVQNGSGRWLLEQPGQLGFGGGVNFDGVVSGHGTLTINTGRGRLTNANTYTGQTILNAGELVVAHANALGVGDGTIANAR
jgi:autotransporter-associated beta strand protein